MTDAGWELIDDEKVIALRNELKSLKDQLEVQFIFTFCSGLIKIS